MNFAWCNADYQTNKFEDVAAGCAGLELSATQNGKTAKVGAITYWDAAGQFVIGPIMQELPLEVLERFIQEAKRTIRNA